MGVSVWSYLEAQSTSFGSEPGVSLGVEAATEQAIRTARPAAGNGARLRLNAPGSIEGAMAWSTLSALRERLAETAREGSPMRMSLIGGLGDDPSRRWFFATLPDFCEATPLAEPFLETLDSLSGGDGKKGLDPQEKSTRIPSATQGFILIETEGSRNAIEALLGNVAEALGKEAPLSAQFAPAQQPSRPPIANAAVARRVDSSRQAALDFRDELLALDWPDGKRVAEMAGAKSETNASQYAARLRAQKRILGVWAATRKTFLHPGCQFNEFGRARPEMKELLEILPASNDSGGWAQAFWLFSPHALLAGQTPSIVMEKDPQRVIAAAKAEFSQEPNANW